MITLYSGPGAQDFQVYGQAMAAEPWRKLKNTTIKFLRSRNHQLAADILERIPFELREGSNGFNDEFWILYWLAPMARYAKAKAWIENEGTSTSFEHIVAVLAEVGTPMQVRFVAVDIDRNEDSSVVETPNLAITSDVVERALNDAETLLGTSGAEAVSAVDRMHTVLHGYLKSVCDLAGLRYESDPSVTKLFKIVRSQHPAFAGTTPYSSEVGRVSKAFASAIDALNTLRNNATPTHPNDVLLEAPEAMLMINAVRTLLHYLNAKIQQLGAISNANDGIVSTEG